VLNKGVRDSFGEGVHGTKKVEGSVAPKRLRGSVAPKRLRNTAAEHSTSAQ
jgi:hypothetical protein